MSLNTKLFQISAHSFHIIQSLDVTAFGTFKKIVITVMTKFGRHNGVEMTVIAHIVHVIGRAWAVSFTTTQIKATFEWAGLGKRKPRSDESPSLVGIPVVVIDKKLTELIGSHSEHGQRNSGLEQSCSGSSLVLKNGNPSNKPHRA